MKIIQLEAENVKRLKAVTIRPDGSVVYVRGNNGQGKTSVLDSIVLALGGKSVQPPKVIREGEDSAQIVVDLGDLVVTRSWTANDKSYLEVRSGEGLKYSSPQAILDKLVGELSFDPLAFMRLDQKKQVETLRKLVGLDFSTLDVKRASVFETRSRVNIEGKALKARFDSLPSLDDVPDELVSLEALFGEQTRLQTEKESNEKARRQLRDLESKHKAACDSHSRKLEEVAELKKRLDAAENELSALQRQTDLLWEGAREANNLVSSLVDPDLSALYLSIRNAEATNQQVRQKKDRAKLEAEVDAKRSESKALSDQLSAIDAEKARLLGVATWPVVGLSFEGEALLFNGIPLEQASSAEQLRVSLAMGIALNPKLKVLLIRDGSLLDEASMKMVAEMAESSDVQVWIETVGKGGSGILIEDGQVALESPQALVGAA